MLKIEDILTFIKVKTALFKWSCTQNDHKDKKTQFVRFLKQEWRISSFKNQDEDDLTLIKSHGLFLKNVPNRGDVFMRSVLSTKKPKSIEPIRR